MNADTQRLDRYRALASAHRAMLVRAHEDDWEGLAEIARQADAIRAELAGLEAAGTPVSPQSRVDQAALIEETLGLIAELRAVAGPAHANLAERLAGDAVQQKVKGAYGL